MRPTFKLSVYQKPETNETIYELKVRDEELIEAVRLAHWSPKGNYDERFSELLMDYAKLVRVLEDAREVDPPEFSVVSDNKNAGR